MNQHSSDLQQPSNIIDPADHWPCKLCLERFAWLRQIYFATRMLEYRECEQNVLWSPLPEHHLKRARELLFRMIAIQMNEQDEDPFIRQGSCMTWWEFRRGHHLYGWHREYFNDDFRDYLPNGEDETFPEGAHPENKPRVDYELRESRYELLHDMEYVLYMAFDMKWTIQDTIKRLWEFFISAMSANLYLLKWHDGANAAKQWIALDKKGTIDFLATFEFDVYAMNRWTQDMKLRIVEHPSYRQTDDYLESLHTAVSETSKIGHRGALGIECAVFNRFVLSLDKTFLDFVVEEGAKEITQDPQEWCHLVQDWVDLDDDDCPVCFTAYDIPSEATTVCSKDHLWDSDDCIPVKLSCDHILCSPCFKAWVESENENKDKCPMCRASIPPINPQKEALGEFVREASRLDDDETLIPQDYAESLLKMVNTYLAQLPLSLQGFSLPEYPMGTLNLAAWRYNIFGSTRALVDLYYNNNPRVDDWESAWKDMADKQSRAALENIYFARDRLEAFLNGDQERYRSVCTRQLYSRAHFENVTFALMQVDMTFPFRQEELV